MSVPKGTTPRPFSSYQQQQRLPDETPAWINDVRHNTPGFGKRARLTAPLKPTDPPPPMHPIMPTTTIKTLDVCWDCGGTGKTGSILRRCPYCGVGWTWEQMEALARRDSYGRWLLPCGDPPVPSVRLKKEAELCPTCYNQPVRGHVVTERAWGDIVEWLVEVIAHNLGMTESELPGVMATFSGSEPTAPAAPLEHPAVHVPERFTPHVSPLSPDDLKEF